MELWLLNAAYVLVVNLTLKTAQRVGARAWGHVCRGAGVGAYAWGRVGVRAWGRVYGEACGGRVWGRVRDGMCVGARGGAWGHVGARGGAWRVCGGAYVSVCVLGCVRSGACVEVRVWWCMRGGAYVGARGSAYVRACA